MNSLLSVLFSALTVVTICHFGDIVLADFNQNLPDAVRRAIVLVFLFGTFSIMAGVQMAFRYIDPKQVEEERSPLIDILPKVALLFLVIGIGLIVLGHQDRTQGVILIVQGILLMLLPLAYILTIKWRNARIKAFFARFRQ